MIDISNVQVFGFEPAIRGMRNPMNSWDKSDSLFFEGHFWHDIDRSRFIDDRYVEIPMHDIEIGDADKTLAMKLAGNGPVHAKYRRMITVYMDILAPLYWWKEFDTYKVGTVANSCSTMHKIHEKEFTLEDFSWEHLIDAETVGPGDDTADECGLFLYELVNLPDSENFIKDNYDNCSEFFWPGDILRHIVLMLNQCRSLYLQTKDKRFWWQMIQLLPSSYNQIRTVMLNYEVLANIYANRKDHKLDEWREFCEYMKDNLPYSELFTDA